MTSKLGQISRVQKLFWDGRKVAEALPEKVNWGIRLLSYTMSIFIIQGVEDAGDIGLAF